MDCRCQTMNNTKAVKHNISVSFSKKSRYAHPLNNPKDPRPQLLLNLRFAIFSRQSSSFLFSRNAPQTRPVIPPEAHGRSRNAKASLLSHHSITPPFHHHSITPPVRSSRSRSLGRSWKPVVGP